MSEAFYFDLAANRIILLEDRNRVYALTCRRITEEDWRSYFSSIVVTAEQEGKSRINTIDVSSPRLALAESVLTGATGYKVADGSELTQIPGWQKKIPLAHRLRLGETVADVRPSQQDEEFTIYPEGEVVLLDATFSAVPTADEYGLVYLAMRRLIGLKHVLRTPTEEQHRRYTREASRSKVVGGSRTGKTIYQGAQLLLAQLYDDLIVSVEGYSVGETPLTVDRAAIVREMDMLHKVIAAQELFQPQDTSAVKDEGDDGE